MLPPLYCDGQWNATAYFTALTQKNKLAKANNFKVVQISGLQGLTDLLQAAKSTPAVIAIDDTSDATWTTSPAPAKTMVKTIYLTMRHAPGDQASRTKAFQILNELFRQTLTILNLEQERLRMQGIQLDPRISAQEVDRYFSPGSACLFANLAIHMPLDLRHRPQEWLP